MNWKTEAINRLRQYNAMKIAVQSIPAEIRRLESEASRIKAVRPGNIHVKNSTNRDDSLLDNLVQREELRYALKNAELWVKTADSALGCLLPEERLVLHRLYITKERGALDRLCQELGCEQTSVYRKKDAALLRFTVALYGFAESQFIRKTAK